MSYRVDYELTGYACQCCIQLHHNGECACDYWGGECSREYMLTGDYTLDVDLDNPHFGYDCIVCSNHSLAGERYDVTLTAWK